MPDRAPRPVRIEFDRTVPLSGRVIGATGTGTPFAGWLELMTVLHALLDDETQGNLVEPPR